MLAFFRILVFREAVGGCGKVATVAGLDTALSI